MLNLLAERPLKPGQIAQELNLTSGSITALIDRLERAGLAERRRDPGDRRSVIIHPTKHLFDTLGPLYSGVAKEIIRIAEGYAPQERRAAVKHLLDACSAYEMSLNSGT